MRNESEVRSLIREELDNYLQANMLDLVGALTTQLSNENGNASVRQSGNGFVYVDNTGIAYALALFFYHFMSEETQQNVDLNEVLNRLDDHISENRQMFDDTIQTLTENMD